MIGGEGNWEPTKKISKFRTYHSYIRTKIRGLRGSCSVSCWSHPFVLSIISVCVGDHIWSCWWSRLFMLLVISIHVVDHISVCIGDHICLCCWSYPFMLLIISVHVIDHIHSYCRSYSFMLSIIFVRVVDHIHACSFGKARHGLSMMCRIPFLSFLHLN